VRRSRAARRRFTGSDGAATSLEGLGWTAALNRYRLLLFYNELGSIFDELKTMYDALAAILGLEDIVGTLREARLERERARRHVQEEAQTLIAELEPLDDERVTAVLSRCVRGGPTSTRSKSLSRASRTRSTPAGELALLRSSRRCGLRTRRRCRARSVILRLRRRQVESLAGSDGARGEPRTCCRRPAVANDR
jgi:hypothetical protein